MRTSTIFDPALVQACANEAERQHKELSLALNDGVEIALTTIPTQAMSSHGRDDLKSVVWDTINKRFQTRITTASIEAPRDDTPRLPTVIGRHKNGRTIGVGMISAGRPDWLQLREDRNDHNREGFPPPKGGH